MSFWSKIGRDARAAAHWVEGAAKDTASWTEGAADDTADWTEGATKDAAIWVEGAADDTADWVEQAAHDTADWTEGAAKDTANWVEGAADYTARGFNDVGADVGHALADAWRSTSRQSAEFADAVEAAGITVSDAFLAGVATATDVLEGVVEDAGEQAGAMLRYLSQHECEIAIGSALAAVFAALAADGEEEAATGRLAVVCAAAEELIDNHALKSASTILAYVVVEPMYAIPAVRKTLGHKSEAEGAVAFLVFKACKLNRKSVVRTAGQFLVAVVIYGITQLVCYGKVAGIEFGWAGLQREITGQSR